MDFRKFAEAEHLLQECVPSSKVLSSGRGPRTFFSVLRSRTRWLGSALHVGWFQEEGGRVGRGGIDSSKFLLTAPAPESAAFLASYPLRADVSHNLVSKTKKRQWLQRSCALRAGVLGGAAHCLLAFMFLQLDADADLKDQSATPEELASQSPRCDRSCFDS